MRSTAHITARRIGDVRELTGHQRAIVDRIDATGGASVLAIVATLKRAGHGERATRREIAAMVERGTLAAQP